MTSLRQLDSADQLRMAMPQQPGAAPASPQLQAAQQDRMRQPSIAPTGMQQQNVQQAVPSVTPSYRRDYMDNTMGSGRTSLDQNAIQRDPQGYAQFQQQAAQRGYNYDAQGNLQSGPQGTSGGQQQTNPYAAYGGQMQGISQDNNMMYNSILPQYTPQQQQLQGYQMQLAGQAANTPSYNYSGIGQQQTQQGLGAVGSALGTVQGLPGIGQYNPITNGRTDSYTTQANNALNGLLGAGNIGGVSGPSAEASSLRQALMSRIGGLEGPDRAALAKSNFDLMQQAYEPQFQQDLRNVGKKAAALGRIGAGMTTSDLGDVAQRKNEYFGRAAQQLSNDAAAASLQDRLASLGGVQGALGQIESADQGRAGLNLQGQGLRLQGQQLARGAANDLFSQGQSLRGEEMANRNFDFTRDQAANNFGLAQAGAMGQLGQQAFNMGQGLRNEQFGYDTARYNSGLAGLGAISNVGQQMYNQNAGMRDELRGERGYQLGLNQQAQNDALQQIIMEQNMMNGQFNNNLSAFNAMLGAGYGADPTSQMNYMAGVNQAGANQAYGGVQDLLSQYFAGQVGGGGGNAGLVGGMMGNVTPNVVGGAVQPASFNPTAPSTFPTRPLPTR